MFCLLNSEIRLAIDLAERIQKEAADELAGAQKDYFNGIIRPNELKEAVEESALRRRLAEEIMKGINNVSIMADKMEKKYK